MLIEAGFNSFNDFVENSILLFLSSKFLKIVKLIEFSNKKGIFLMFLPKLSIKSSGRSIIL